MKLVQHSFELYSYLNFQVKKFSVPFNKHAYLWQDDRNELLRQFLAFSRYLLPNEIDLEGKFDEEGKPYLEQSPPKLDSFKAQVFMV